MRERTQLDTSIERVRDFGQRLEDALTLIELGEAEDERKVLPQELYVPEVY